MPRAEDARTTIAQAALPLLAEHGIDGVSSREILRVGGQRNSNAIQYHFGDRDGLVRAALLPLHQRVLDRRETLLDEFSDSEPLDTRSLAIALVEPLATMLDVPGGKHYLRVVAELNDDPGRFPTLWETFIGQSSRWNRIAEAIMPTEIEPLHRRYAAIQLAYSELRRRASTARRADHRLFESDLVDLVTSILDTAPSPTTRRLLKERDLA